MTRAIFLSATLLLAACTTVPSPTTTVSRPVVTGPQIIPAPALLTIRTEAPFDLNRATSIVVNGANAEVTAIAQALATLLRPATGFPLAVSSSLPDTAAGNIHFSSLKSLQQLQKPPNRKQQKSSMEAHPKHRRKTVPQQNPPPRKLRRSSWKATQQLMSMETRKRMRKWKSKSQKRNEVASARHKKIN